VCNFTSRLEARGLRVSFSARDFKSSLPRNGSCGPDLRKEIAVFHSVLKISFDWVCVSFAWAAFDSTMADALASAQLIKTTAELPSNFWTRYSPPAASRCPPRTQMGCSPTWARLLAQLEPPQ